MTRQRPGRGFLPVLSLSGLTLAALAIAGTLAWHHFRDGRAIAGTLERVAPWLALWRASLFVVLIGFWPGLMSWIAERYDWSAAQRRHAMSQRWRVALWLIVIELLLVENVVGGFVHSLGS